MTERADDAQQMALRAFLLLCSLADDWPGKLVLVRGLDAEGRAVSVAATIAGAACLALDSRADVCRATLRAGASDFVVNSVDEALRILKNEIRKRKPVSVAVAMLEAAALEELAERGVAPEALVCTTASAADASGGFGQFGTRIVEAGDMPKLVANFAVAHQLAIREFCFTTPEELREFDRRLAGCIPEGDLRRRWAALAPGYFYRERPPRRVAYLTDPEAAALPV